MKIPANKVPAQVWAEKETRTGGGGVYDDLLEKWGRSKQVYRVDDALWEAAAVDQDDIIPVAALRALPYDCVFIEHKSDHEARSHGEYTGGVHEMSTSVAGYYCWKGSDGSGEWLGVATLSSGTSRKHTLGLDGSSRQERLGLGVISVVTLPFGDDKLTVSDAVSDALGHYIASLGRTAVRAGINFMDEGEKAFLGSMMIVDSDLRREAMQLEKVLGSLLYIISKDADVRRVYAPQRNRPPRSKQTDCAVHEVGFNIARDLRVANQALAREKSDSEKSNGSGTGRHVRTHVRRAHWHAYWTGPRDNPTGLEIKWIAPVVVNADRGDVEGTVHLMSGDGRDEVEQPHPPYSLSRQRAGVIGSGGLEDPGCELHVTSLQGQEL